MILSCKIPHILVKHFSSLPSIQYYKSHIAIESAVFSWLGRFLPCKFNLCHTSGPRFPLPKWGVIKLLSHHQAFLYTSSSLTWSFCFLDHCSYFPVTPHECKYQMSEKNMKIVKRKRERKYPMKYQLRKLYANNKHFLPFCKTSACLNIGNRKDWNGFTRIPNIWSDHKYLTMYPGL